MDTRVTNSAIVVNHAFDGYRPFAADHARAMWNGQGNPAFIRLEAGDNRRVGELAVPMETSRLLSLGVPLMPECVIGLPRLRELAVSSVPPADSPLRGVLAERQVQL